MLFFDANRGLHAEKSPGFIERLQRLEQACRAAGIAIFYAQAEHRKDGKDWGVTVVHDAPRNYDQPKVGHLGVTGETTFRGVNYKGSDFAKIIPEIEPKDGDYIIAKHRWSAFYQTCLELSLRTAKIDTIMLAGGATEIGIASTAYSARDHDYNLIIIRDACREWAPGMNDIWMDRIFPQMSRVMNAEEAIALFELPVSARVSTASAASRG